MEVYGVNSYLDNLSEACVLLFEYTLSTTAVGLLNQNTFLKTDDEFMLLRASIVHFSVLQDRFHKSNKTGKKCKLHNVT